LPVEKPPVQVNPAFLTFFRQAVKFSKALYGDAGTDPNFKYSLTPKKSDQVSTFILTVNGEQSKLDGGSAKAFVWPGAKHNFKVDLGLASGGVLEGEMRETLWAAFRFFADADRAVTNGNSYDFYWSVRQGRENKPLSVNGHPLVYTFTFEANGAPAIFSKEFLAGMRCIPTIAK
jgi:type VI protein secretion system component VasK